MKKIRFIGDDGDAEEEETICHKFWFSSFLHFDNNCSTLIDPSVISIILSSIVGIGPPLEWLLNCYNNKVAPVKHFQLLLFLTFN